MGDLLKAVKTGNSEKVKDLIEKGALEGFRDDKGRGYTPLHWAAIFGYTDIIDLLLREMLNVNEQEHNGWTSLHYAAYYGRVQAVSQLVAAGADPTLLSNGGKTPLQFAKENNKVAVMHVLEHGKEMGNSTPSHKTEITKPLPVIGADQVGETENEDVISIAPTA